MNLQNVIRLSFVEGASLLILLFIAMPMKYIAGDPSLVRSIGMIHGVLFIALVAIIAILAKRDNWSSRIVAISLVCASLPFGMFVFERLIRNFYKQSNKSQS